MPISEQPPLYGTARTPFEYKHEIASATSCVEDGCRTAMGSVVFRLFHSGTAVLMSLGMVMADISFEERHAVASFILSSKLSGLLGSIFGSGGGGGMPTSPITPLKNSSVKTCGRWQTHFRNL